MRVLLIRVHPSEHFFRRRVPAMAIQAPPHGQGSDLVNLLHPTNIPVTGLTCDPFRHVTLVIEVSVVRQLMNSDPFHRLTRVEMLSELLNMGTIRLHY